MSREHTGCTRFLDHGASGVLCAHRWSSRPNMRLSSRTGFDVRVCTAPKVQPVPRTMRLSTISVFLSCNDMMQCHI